MSLKSVFIMSMVVLFTGVFVSDIHAESGMEFDISLIESPIQSSSGTDDLIRADKNSGGGQNGSRFVECDDFNRADGTIVTGWTEQTADWQISSNQLMAPAVPAGRGYITYDGSSLTGDFCVTTRVTHSGPAATQYGAALGWYQSDTTNLYFKVQDNWGVGFFNSIGLYQNSSGLFQDSLDFGTDIIIQLEVVGTTAYGRIDEDRDGTFDYEYTQTIVPSDGLCGATNYALSVLFDDWCYGDECGSMSPTNTPTATPTETPTHTSGPTGTPTPIPPLPTTGFSSIILLLIVIGGFLATFSGRKK